MTFTELRQHESVKSSEIVHGGALLTYTALGDGECDQCEQPYAIGADIIGLHEKVARQFEPEVSQAFCSRECAMCWLEMHRG